MQQLISFFAIASDKLHTEVEQRVARNMTRNTTCKANV